MLDSLKKNSIAVANRYEVMFSIPSYDGGPEFLRHLSIRCESVSLPGRSIATYPYRLYGPARNMPYEQIYSGEISLTFLMNSDWDERGFFENWMFGVCGTHDFKINFQSSYKAMMTITTMDKTDTPIIQMILVGVYPKIIGDIQLGYDKDNEVVRQDVTFCYRMYDIIGVKPEPEPLP